MRWAATTMARESAELPLGFTIELYGNNYNSFYLNNNGNITFVGPVSIYSAEGFPQNTSRPMMAPFLPTSTRGGLQAARCIWLVGRPHEATHSSRSIGRASAIMRVMSTSSMISRSTSKTTPMAVRSLDSFIATCSGQPAMRRRAAVGLVACPRRSDSMRATIPIFSALDGPTLPKEARRVRQPDDCLPLESLRRCLPRRAWDRWHDRPIGVDPATGQSMPRSRPGPMIWTATA